MISIQTVDSSRIKTLEIKGKIIQNQENQKDLLKLVLRYIGKENSHINMEIKSTK